MASFLSYIIISMLLPVLPLTSEAHSQLHALSMKERLESEPVAQCWDSLMELRSCTGEVILFFLNGETYLGPSCCRAIAVIEDRCWAADAMFAALGFTVQEGHILKGYCEYSAPADAPPHHANTAPPPSLNIS